MQEVDVKSGRLSSLLTQAAPNAVFVSLLLGIFSGIASSALIPLILASLEYIFSDAAANDIRYVGNLEIAAPRFAVAFCVACAFALTARATSIAILNVVAQRAALRLRVNLYQRIMAAPIFDLERIGKSRVLAALTNDAPRIVTAATVIPSIFMHSASVVSLLAVLAYLNWQVFKLAFIALLVGVVTYRIPLAFGRSLLAKARHHLDEVHEGIQALLQGAKELKLSHARRRRFLAEELVPSEQAYRRLQTRGMIVLIASVAYGDLICFIAVGQATFLMSTLYNVSQATLVAAVMVILSVVGPISSILNGIMPIAEGGVSAKRLDALLKEIPQEIGQVGQAVTSCKHLRLTDVCFRYQDAGSETEFELGPIDLELHAGRINVIAGGNGSGKTTLAKLLSLLYVPHAGNIFIDGNAVTDQNRGRYRELVSSIYRDYFVFQRLPGEPNERQTQLANRELRELGLADKVKIRDGKLSTVALSEGQRKRLALLVAHLEDRSIYVLDEWAAEQDPKFKEVFYHRLLPYLKNAGKIIIVISHDDRYFGIADQIVRIENGKLIADDTACRASRHQGASDGGAVALGSTAQLRQEGGE